MSTPNQNQDVMGIGSTGHAVTALQRKLKLLGEAVEVNGRYDRATQSAVMAVQRRCGLFTTGTADGKTLKAIELALQEKSGQKREMPTSIPRSKEQLEEAVASLDPTLTPPVSRPPVQGRRK